MDDVKIPAKGRDTDTAGPMSSARGALRTIEEELGALRGSARKVSAGSVLLQDGEEWDQVLIVLDGWLATSKSFEDGEIQIVDFGLPGDILDPAGGDGETAGVAVDAITDATVVMVPLGRWHAMLNASPRLADLVDHIRAAGRARAAERLLRLGKGTAAARVTYALLELCIRLNAIGAAQSESACHLPLTQKDIGDFTGLSSVHVCRTMRRLVRHQIIETEDHLDIRIRDIEALSDLAQADPALLAREITAIPN